MALKTRKREPAPAVPPPITVRRLRPGDGPILTYLAQNDEDFGGNGEREPLPPLSEPETVAFLADDRTAMFVAFSGDEPVGFCYANELYRRHTALRHLCIYELSVSERFRNQGIGQALLDAVGDHALNQGVDRGFVITSSGNAPAMHLYQSAGGVRTADDDAIFAFTWA